MVIPFPSLSASRGPGLRLLPHLVSIRTPQVLLTLGHPLLHIWPRVSSEKQIHEMGVDYEREGQNSRFAAQLISCLTLNPPT